MNLGKFNSFIVKKKIEVDYFVLFHVKLDTHAQRDVHTKQTHTRALYARTLRQIFFILLIAILFILDRGLAHLSNQILKLLEHFVFVLSSMV